MPIKKMRWIEMAGIFVGIPLLLSEESCPQLKSVTMLVVCIACFLVLLRDKTFDRSRFGLNGFRNWRALFMRFVIIAGCLALYTALAEPGRVLTMLRHNPARWALITLIYPVLSVVPQEIIYRTFYFHRYGSLFTDKKLSVIINAALFAFAHIFFGNRVAVIGAFAAGLIWATTYLGSRSLLVVSIEHALYGELAFTLGIGYYFYDPDF